METILHPTENAALFEGLEPEQQKAIMHCLHAREKSYKKGEIIIMDQDKVHHVGIVQSGTVHMLKEDIWGNQTLFAYIRPGELMGELFAVQKQTDSYVTFVAATDAKILFLRAENIIHDCPKQCLFHHRLTQNMFDLLGQKGVQLLEKIEVSSKPTMREKLLAYLSMQAQKQDTRYITLPLSRTELAVYLGVNRSAMTRELSAMRDEGLIDFDRNTFVLKK